MRFSAAATTGLLLSVFNPALATLCPLSTEGLTGLNEVISLPTLGKLSVIDFSATVSYTTIAAGKFV